MNGTEPMLEVLAGIPSIVYGLFALLTVGTVTGGVRMLADGKNTPGKNPVGSVAMTTTW